MVKILIKKPVEFSTGLCLKEAVKEGENSLAVVLPVKLGVTVRLFRYHKGRPNYYAAQYTNNEIDAQ
jgi:hypothetical protein